LFRDASDILSNCCWHENSPLFPARDPLQAKLRGRAVLSSLAFFHSSLLGRTKYYVKKEILKTE
jgi:hypothetical protein